MSPIKKSKPLVTDHPQIALVQQLTTALVKAQEHLDYCGYGDPWEHECAEEAQLPQLIADAVEAGRVELNKEGITV